MKAVLIRLTDDGKQTLGQFEAFSGISKVFECKTLELPWKDNKKEISCIPAGTYQVRKHNSPTFGRCFKVHDVPGRSEILIHKGNFNRDTHGCILVGAAFIDVNSDGTTDISSSGATFEKMMMHLAEEFTLTII